MHPTRRVFLSDVGKGMLAAGLGAGMASELGINLAFAEEGSEELTFGPLEPLTRLLQETPAEKLTAVLVQKINSGTELRQLVAAAALANARTFAGEDYVGFHTLMALMPAFHMAAELPDSSRALPVLKVLYRNSNRIQESGGPKSTLKPIKPGDLASDKDEGELLRAAARRQDRDEAERIFASVCSAKPSNGLNELLTEVEDATEVHRVVLVSRAWELIDLVGKTNAHTMLRQSVRYCVKNESPNYIKHCGGARDVVPKMLEQHKLLGRTPGKRTAEDAWVDKLSRSLFQATPEQAAGIAAAALAEGFPAEAVAEAISLAANQLVLRDKGRPANQTSANKPVGSIHGDSIGVHACDSANAWRKLARAANAQHAIACTVLGAYQVAQDRLQRGGDFQNWEPYPLADAREKTSAKEPEVLLHEAEAAIRDKDQPRVSAAVARYGELGFPERAMFDLMLKYALSEDGALHAEKFYRTTSEEFAATRKPFRWRQLIALSRVTASAYGQPAPGQAEARKLLQG